MKKLLIVLIIVFCFPVCALGVESRTAGGYTDVSDHVAESDPHTQYAKESVVGTSLNADDLELNGTVLQTAAEIPHIDAAQSWSADQTFNDGVARIFGTDGDLVQKYTASDSATAIANSIMMYDVGGAAKFWLDLTNGTINSVAKAVPGFSAYDLNAAVGASTNLVDVRAKQYAGGWEWNMTTTTDGEWASDAMAYAMVGGSKTLVAQFDVSNSQWDFSDYPVRTYEEIQMIVVDFGTEVSTGDGKFYFHIGQKLAGMNLTYAHAENVTASTGSGVETITIQIYNATDSQDMLSTALTIDEDETGSDTAEAAYAINATYDDVAENDVIRIDIDAIPSTTGGNGLIVTLGFNIP